MNEGFGGAGTGDLLELAQWLKADFPLRVSLALRIVLELTI